MTAPPPSSGPSPRSVPRSAARVLAAVAALAACLATAAPTAHATAAAGTASAATAATAAVQPATLTVPTAPTATTPATLTIPTAPTATTPAPAHVAAKPRHRAPKRPRHRARAAGGCLAVTGNLTTRRSVLLAQRRMLCLMNHMRARFGLPPLHSNRCLHRVAARHAHDMVHRHYFAHTTPNGWDPGRRARASGYVPRAAAWIVGENIAWGVGGAATAGWVFNAWMHSAPHRHNILDRRFRDVGIGVSRGIPVHGFGGYRLRATFSVDFGAEHGRTRCGS